MRSHGFMQDPEATGHHEWKDGGKGVLAYLAQRRLLYFPTRSDIDVSTRLAGTVGLEPWLDGAGRFIGWRAPHPDGAPVARAVVLHGNAGTALDRIYLRDVLQGPGLPRIEVLLLEYPGYGPRTGSPSQESIVAATVEAIDLLGGEVPVFLVGGQDEVVFADLGRALFEAYPGPKRMWEEQGASHNTLRFRPGDPLWAEVWKFLGP